MELLLNNESRFAHSPNQGRRVACGSQDSVVKGQAAAVRLGIALILALGILAIFGSLFPLSQAVAQSPENTGSIHGQVTITRKLTSQRMRFRLYPGFKPQPPPRAEEMGDDERRNVVVYLQNAAPTGIEAAHSEPIEIIQLGETFIPHILPIVQGSTVEFPNQDPIFHNVFSLSGTRTFDLGRYPQGDSRSVTFEEPGIVPVFCHLHSDMSATILVLDNPFFTVPNAEGKYVIDGIPEGTYTLVGWHERSEPTEQQVTVIAGESVELNVVIPIEDEEL